MASRRSRQLAGGGDGGCNDQLSHRFQRSNYRLRLGRIEQRLEPRGIAAISEPRETPGGRSADRGRRIPEENTQLLASRFRRILAEQTRRHISGRRGLQSDLGPAGPRRAWKAVQLRNQPRHQLITLELDQAFDDRCQLRSQVPERRDRGPANQGIGVDDSAEQRLGRLSVAELSEAEGRGEPHGGHLVSQERLENRPPTNVTDRRDGEGQTFPHRRIASQCLIDRERLVRLAIDEEENHRPQLEIGRRGARFDLG